MLSDDLLHRSGRRARCVTSCSVVYEGEPARELPEDLFGGVWTKTNTSAWYLKIVRTRTRTLHNTTALEADKISKLCLEL